MPVCPLPVRLAHACLMLCVAALGCVAPRGAPRSEAGTLLLVGGGLDDDCWPVYRTFVDLASARGPARIVIATAATGPEEEELIDKTEALAIWAPGVPVRGVGRGTPTDETVAAFDAATAALFTGGDQERITARYRPGGADTPEWLALERLLARGGVIAGCSAGDAMMGALMLVGGTSARALGVAPPASADGGDAPTLGPQVAPGMGFLPFAMTDSHFFERDRIGRLVAALEASETRLGIGVGEDGAVAIDLATGELVNVGIGESLLVDIGRLRRVGDVRTDVLARPIGVFGSIALRERAASPPPPVAARPGGAPRLVPVVEPGQNRQLASWRVFRRAALPGASEQRLELEGWYVAAWPGHDGEVVCEVGPR